MVQRKKPTVSAKDRYLSQMRDEQISLSRLSMHLNALRGRGQIGAEAADQLEADLYETFGSESGLRVMKLMEKSVLHLGLPSSCSDSALRENEFHTRHQENCIKWTIA